jgi:Uma2 family endonuclease
LKSRGKKSKLKKAIEHEEEEPMAEPARKKASYEDLYAIPENMTGEIVDGGLIVTPRPSKKHVYTASRLDKEIGPPYELGRNGPGGWIILVEPEIKLDENTVVPDLAGWKKERFPATEETNWISVAPDWVCEILSPSTFRTDKVKKMPLYARYGVGHIWLIDPVAMTLDVFKLEANRWFLLGSYTENDKACIEPFQEIEIDLASLWIGNLQSPAP